MTLPGHRDGREVFRNYGFFVRDSSKIVLLFYPKSGLPGTFVASPEGRRTVALTWRKVHVVDRGEHGERQRGQERDDPKDGDDAHGPFQPGHGVRVERMTDGQVPFHGERHDGQHRRVRSPVNGAHA